jgi:hypothetical protein
LRSSADGSPQGAAVSNRRRFYRHPGTVAVFENRLVSSFDAGQNRGMKPALTILLLVAFLRSTDAAPPTAQATPEPWYKRIFLPRPNPTPSVAVPEPVIVKKIKDHGETFGFNRWSVDKILGRPNWHRERLWASSKPEGQRRAIMLWRSSGHMSFVTGHGRYDDSHKAKDWHVGDKIYVFEKAK